MATQTVHGSTEPNPHLGSVVGALDAATHQASLHLRGDLCAFTAAEHGRQLADLVDQGYVQLRVELADLALCTSDGLDCWDDLQHRLAPLDGMLTLAGATGVVRRVLDVVTRLEGHFCPTVEAAAA